MVVSVVTLTAFNKTKALEDWVQDPLCVVDEAELRQRLAKGWMAERALTTPVELPVSNPRDRKRRKHSRYRGVTWNEGKGMWKAQVWHKGTTVFVGYFESERDAALAYNGRARELLGTDGKLNRV